jgi:hypothetical protein
MSKITNLPNGMIEEYYDFGTYATTTLTHTEIFSITHLYKKISKKYGIIYKYNEEDGEEDNNKKKK